MPGGLIISVLGAGIVGTLPAAPEARASEQNVRVSDEASVSGGRSAVVSNKGTARFAGGRGTEAVSRLQAAPLIDHALHEVQVADENRDSITAQAAPSEKRLECRRMLAAVPAGSFIIKADTTRVECDVRRVAAKKIRFSSTGEATAAVTLHPGDYLGRVLLPDAQSVRRGERLVLTSSVGPVLVRRPVIAMQSATSPQQRLFVRTEEGEVFAAPIASETGE